MTTHDPFSGASLESPLVPSETVRARITANAALPLLWAAVAAVLIGLLTLMLSGLGTHVAGYALSAPVSFTAVALFRRRSLELLFTAGVAPSRRDNSLAVAALILGFLAAVGHAWAIASHFA